MITSTCCPSSIRDRSSFGVLQYCPSMGQFFIHSLHPMHFSFSSFNSLLTSLSNFICIHIIPLKDSHDIKRLLHFGNNPQLFAYILGVSCFLFRSFQIFLNNTIITLRENNIKRPNTNFFTPPTSIPPT